MSVDHCVLHCAVYIRSLTLGQKALATHSFAFGRKLCTVGIQPSDYEQLVALAIQCELNEVVLLNQLLNVITSLLKNLQSAIDGWCNQHLFSWLLQWLSLPCQVLAATKHPRYATQDQVCSYVATIHCHTAKKCISTLAILSAQHTMTVQPSTQVRPKHLGTCQGSLAHLTHCTLGICLVRVNFATRKAPACCILPALHQQHPLHVLIQQDATHDRYVLFEDFELLHDLLNVTLQLQSCPLDMSAQPTSSG
jgi:hypothetical protein